MWEPILSDDADTIRRLQEDLGLTQAQAVDEFIQTSCWAEDVPHLLGNRAPAAERLAALRAAYRTQNAPHSDIDLDRLTRVERALAEALQVTFVYVPHSEAATRALIADAQDAEEAKTAGRTAASIESPLRNALHRHPPLHSRI
jgi:hypothetical protein